MQRYKNLSGKSGVLFFDYGDDFITVQFQSSSSYSRTTYTYTNQSAGAGHVAEMKRLADRGEGLSAYITKNVKYKYVRD